MRFVMKKSPVLGLFAFMGIVILTGCQFGSNKVGSQVVLQVNEHKLTAKDFAEQLVVGLKSFDALAAKDPNNIARAKNDVIKNFILQSIIKDYAKLQNIQISDSELEAEVNSVRSGYPDDLAFRRMLAQEGLSLSGWKESLRQTLVDQKVFKIIGEKIPKPTTEEIKRYYDDNKDKYRRRERIYLRQIIVDDLTKAQSIKDELGKKQDFATLASKYSVAPEAKSGGVVGWVEKGSVDIFDKAFLLPVGGISQVLESSYGFHIFKVDRKAPAGYASIEEVRDQISQVILGKKEQAEFMGWLDKQIRTARVMKNTELIQSISVETRGTK
ncbi:MAG: hypothetical protein BroJett040_09520 [Oligoflexia bacterium]|nr:MAG: hypothetical protein BroJett040_09520 [Oligoflexia bacterium]